MVLGKILRAYYFICMGGNVKGLLIAFTLVSFDIPSVCNNYYTVVKVAEVLRLIYGLTGLLHALGGAAAVCIRGVGLADLKNLTCSDQLLEELTALRILC